MDSFIGFWDYKQIFFNSVCVCVYTDFQCVCVCVCVFLKGSYYAFSLFEF